MLSFGAGRIVQEVGEQGGLGELLKTFITVDDVLFQDHRPAIHGRISLCLPPALTDTPLFYGDGTGEDAENVAAQEVLIFALVGIAFASLAILSVQEGFGGGNQEDIVLGG